MMTFGWVHRWEHGCQYGVALLFVRAARDDRNMGRGGGVLEGWEDVGRCLTYIGRV
jgi:hypothetical protein